ncbi:lipase family protein [Rhodococcus daqingensis]|uniref:Lipase family protein n=1 Tax=Rhodococcus daqingensis TaxID=2479363 RepID=A0ABW2RUK7_9NOCA
MHLGGMMSVIVSSLIAVGACAHAHATPPAAVPGSIVSSSALSGDGLIDGAAEGYLLTYNTTGQDGRPALSTGQVFLPRGNAPAGGWPVVSWSHGTTGVGDQCAPSVTGSLTTTQPLVDYLRRGYAVVATDYIGLGSPGIHQYLAGRAEGHAAIDIVRAGRSLLPDLSPSWVSIGHSQGGQAALFAGRMAGEYAPELDFRGTLSYAPESNVENLVIGAGPYVPSLDFLDGASTYLVYILAGLNAARPDLRIPDHLTDFGVRAVASAELGCGDDLDMLKGTAMGALFAEPLLDPAVVAALQDYMAVPTTGWDRPVMIVHGSDDVTVPLPLSVALHLQLAAGGADAQLKVYPGTDHRSVLPASDGDATRFLTALLPPPR